MNRTIVITGASSGIGLALVRELAKPGNHLVLLARRTSVLNDLATEVRESGAKATVKTIDFTDRGAWPRTYQSLKDEGITIDALYHCAVRISAGALHHTLPGDWEQIYRVNLLSTTSILSTLYVDMVKRKQGNHRALLLSHQPFGSPHVRPIRCHQDRSLRIVAKLEVRK